MAQIQAQAPRLFILGVERSGSTWLANLLDASPAVEAFMEPFSEEAHIFRGFPDRLTYMGSCSDQLRDQLQAQFARLPEMKYYGWEDREAPAWRRRTNWRYQQWLLATVNKSLGQRTGWAEFRYRELNLNRNSNPRVFDFEKTSPPELEVIKELRVNLKVRVLREVFPQARFIVILRNPLAQIRSMLRLFERDALVYLRHYLGSFFEVGSTIDRLRPFVEAAETVDDSLRDAPIMLRAVAYWFANYGLLLEDLEATGADFMTVRHEALSESPMQVTERLYDFAGLEFSDQTREYVDHSSNAETKTDQKRDGQTADSSAFTDTTRDSSDLYKRRLGEIPDPERRRFWSLAAPFWSMVPETLADYRQWLEGMIEPQ